MYLSSCITFPKARLFKTMKEDEMKYYYYLFEFYFFTY